MLRRGVFDYGGKSLKKKEPIDEFTRRRLERQRRIRKRRLFIFFCFMLFLLLCTAVVLSFTVFFPIEKINASGSTVYTAEQLEAECGVEKGDNLLSVSRAGITAKLKKRLPYVESVKLKKKLPDTLSITVTDAEEYCCYELDGKYYTVSRVGWVLKQGDSPPEGVFTVKGCKAECAVGTELAFEKERESELVTEIIEALSEKEIKIDYIDISDLISLKIGVEGRFTVELGTSNYIDGKINHLSGMLSSIGEEKQGKINLSMWTDTDTKGTFVEGKNE